MGLKRKPQEDLLDRDVLGDIQRARFLQTRNARKCYFGTGLPQLMSKSQDSDEKKIDVVVNITTPQQEQVNVLPAPNLPEQQVPPLQATPPTGGAGALPQGVGTPSPQYNTVGGGGVGGDNGGGGISNGGYQPYAMTPAQLQQQQNQIELQNQQAQFNQQNQQEKQLMEIDAKKLSKADFTAKYGITEESYDRQYGIFKPVDFSALFIRLAYAIGTGSEKYGTEQNRYPEPGFKFPTNWDSGSSDSHTDVVDLKQLAADQKNHINVFDKVNTIVNKLNKDFGVTMFATNIKFNTDLDQAAFHIEGGQDGGQDMMSIVEELTKQWYSDTNQNLLHRLDTLPGWRNVFNNRLFGYWKKTITLCKDNADKLQKTTKADAAAELVKACNDAKKELKVKWGEALDVLSKQGLQPPQSTPPVLTISLDLLDKDWTSVSNSTLFTLKAPEGLPVNPSVPPAETPATAPPPVVPPPTTDNANASAPPPGAKDQPMAISKELDSTKYQTQPVQPIVPITIAQAVGKGITGGTTGLIGGTGHHNMSGLTAAQAQQFQQNRAQTTQSNSAPTNEAAPKTDVPSPATGVNPSAPPTSSVTPQPADQGLYSRGGQGGPSPIVPLPTTAAPTPANNDASVTPSLKDLLAKLLVQNSA
jgi:hypothetical protein